MTGETLGGIKRLFQNHGGFITALNFEKTIPDYYFNSNNCYNRTSIHIIRSSTCPS